MNNAQSQKTVFDLHVRGLGYLSRVREVVPQASKGRAKAKPFLACSIGAFHGEPDSLTYVNFDTKVVGEKAKEVIQMLMDAANDKSKKVLIGFNIGDIYPDSYTITKGERAGQLANVLKGRLLKVKWAKVDGKLVYKEDHSASEDENGSNERTGTEG
jgi:hypothetical protein